MLVPRKIMVNYGQIDRQSPMAGQGGKALNENRYLTHSVGKCCSEWESKLKTLAEYESTWVKSAAGKRQK